MPLRDPDRLDRIHSTLRAAKIDAFISALPQNVAMLTGYSPVIGTAVAIAARDSEPTLLVPKDEADEARSSSGLDPIPFEPGSLHELRTAAQALRNPLRDAVHGLKRATIGLELGECSQPAPYSAL